MAPILDCLKTNSKANMLKKYKIGGVPEHFNYPWRKAIEDHDFERLNVALHWSDMTGGTGQMIKGLETGTLDIAVLLTEGITKAILQGTPAKILDFYVTSPLQWGIHVSKILPTPCLKELRNPRVAISRYGSGSHLMAYVLAQREGWDLSKLSFNVIGDVYGGIWALENKEADLFLWEKYTTQPFVDKGSCTRIDQIDTPWPCFVIACRKTILENDYDTIRKIIEVVKEKAKKIKQDPHSIESISWRYHLAQDSVEKWFHETTWNTETLPMTSAIQPAIDFLSASRLIDPKPLVPWSSELF